MGRWLVPDRHVRSVEALDPAALAADGVEGLLLDLDNTLLPWDASSPSAEVVRWVQRLRAAGLRMCIVSNNFTGRARAVGALLGLPVVGPAVKPAPWALRRALAVLGTPPERTALIGDQVFTDVLGGNLLGLHTILVDPLSSAEFITTKLVRAVERLVRARVIAMAGRPSRRAEAHRPRR